jgi:hypothetical protein
MLNSPSTSTSAGSSTHLVPVAAAEPSGAASVRERGMLTPVASIGTGSIGESLLAWGRTSQNLLASVRSSQGMLAVAAFGMTTLALAPNVDALLGMSDLELTVLAQPRPTSSTLDLLVASVTDEPVEEGEPHPVQQLVDRLVGDGGAIAMIERAFGRATNPGVTAGLLRLLGRAPLVGVDARHEALTRGLASRAVIVRDAAVQAAEHWNDPGLVEPLRRHRDDVGWLAEYVAAVARDLAS